MSLQDATADDALFASDTEWFTRTGMCGMCGRDGTLCAGYCSCDRAMCRGPRDGRDCDCRCGCWRCTASTWMPLSRHRSSPGRPPWRWSHEHSERVGPHPPQ